MDFNRDKLGFIVELYQNKGNKTYSDYLLSRIKKFMCMGVEVCIQTNTKNKYKVYLVNEYTFYDRIEFTKEDLTYYLLNFIINNDGGITTNMYFELLGECYNSYKYTITEMKKELLLSKDNNIVDYIKSLEVNMNLVKEELVKYDDIIDIFGESIVTV